MENSINSRFAGVLAYSGLNVTKFAEQLGIAQPTAKAIIEGNNAPSYKAIDGLLIGFPMISAEWLLRGEGDMIKGGVAISNTNNNIVNKNHGHNINTGSGVINENSNDIVRQLIEQNNILTEQNKKLVEALTNR